MSLELLDGAMGSEFIKRNITLPKHVWSANINLEAQELLYQIHCEYIDAGANYLTTNTFRAAPRAYQKLNIDDKDANRIAKQSLKSAVTIAKKAACSYAKVLGSIAPLEDCYRPDLFPGKDIALKEFILLPILMYLLFEDGMVINLKESGFIALKEVLSLVWLCRTIGMSHQITCPLKYTS